MSNFLYHCTRCDGYYTARYFYKCTTNKYRDGLSCHCRDCIKLANTLREVAAKKIVKKQCDAKDNPIIRPFECVNGITLFNAEDLADMGIIIKITNIENPDEAISQHLRPDQARDFIRWCNKTDCAAKP